MTAILPSPIEARDMPDGGAIGPVQSGWKLALREFAQNKMAVLGLVVLVFFIVLCFIGPMFYHGNIMVSNLTDTSAPPGAGQPLGTDNQGFDELGLIMKGGQASLEVGFFAAAVGIVIGVLFGAISGLVGGLVDAVMMRINEIFLSVPYLFVVLIVAVRYGASVLSLSLIIAAATWQVPARLIRGEVLTLRTRDFIAAAQVAGSGKWRLIMKHLLPNSLGVVIVNGTFQIADAILAVAALGFLGFGLHYPSQDWGDMLSNGINYMQDGYWWLIYPVGICIVLVVMACNLVGDALRDAFDVRLRRR
jgi:ABC-type dipeptide/oligopeptide/nickel transport system permease subunit